MTHRHLWPLSVALLMGIAFSGCGQQDPLGRQAISGEVTLDGKPLEQGSITFLPEGKKDTSGGAAIAAGKYTIAREQGLAPGKYKVMISASKGGGAAGNEAPGMPMPVAELIPEEYNAKSDKIVDVTEKGPNTFKFDIATKKK